MSEQGATAVSFTLLSWVLLWWVAFELWPELRAAKLRLRLRRLELEQNSPEMLDVLEAAARQADEFRWLRLLRSRERDCAREEGQRAAWEIVRHVAWGAPWLWPGLRKQAARQRWMRRAWAMACQLAEDDPGR
ncbi:MAG: hypothetical protein ACOYX1_18285 [Acidobacteriota bacterium]